MKSQETARATPPPSASAVTTLTNLRQEKAQIIGRLNDGDSQIVLSGTARVSGIDHLPPQYQRMIQKALSSRRLEKSLFLTELFKYNNLSVRSEDKQGAEFSVIEPVKIVILTDRPTHLTLALIYTRAGLLDDAEREFQKLQKANPHSTITRRLLTSLRAMRL